MLMTPQDENAVLMRRVEDSSLRQLWRLTNTLINVRHGRCPLEMLKMKEPPGMYMKTQARGQNVHPKNGFFTRKCSNCSIIDNNLSGLLAETATIAR